MKSRSEFEARSTGLFGEGCARGEFLKRGEAFEVVVRGDPWDFLRGDFGNECFHGGSGNGFDVDHAGIRQRGAQQGYACGKIKVERGAFCMAARREKEREGE
jgi:hypothetical protein